MIEISISRELAADHPGFMASCAQRGHAVSVFDGAAARSPTHETTGVPDVPAGTTPRVARDRSPGGRTDRPDEPEPGGGRPDLRRPALPAPNRTERRPPYGLRRSPAPTRRRASQRSRKRVSPGA